MLGSSPARRSASFFVLLGLGLLGSWIASCKEDDGGRACVPNEKRQCAGAGRCVGSHTCLPDGSGYGECDCSGPLRQETMAPPAGEITPVVGRNCTTDENCGEGLRCYAASSNDLFGGGPAGGYCSLPCTSNASCTAVDLEAECVGLPGTQSVCIRTCRSLTGPFNPEAPALPPLAENKCLSRPDLVCLSEFALGQAMFTGSRQPGWCFPQCGSDEECGDRRCDLSRGLCVDGQATGLALGERCTNLNECSGGLCIDTTGDGAETFCSAPCVVGQPVGCGYGASAVVREAGCLGPRFGGFTGNEGYGDTGFCAELCDVDADCVQAASRGWRCILNDVNQRRFGRAGVCGPPGPSDAGTDAGDTDAAAPLDASTGG
jgi:hypothetical protein